MEREFLAWLTERLPPEPRVPLGVGDDAALLACRPGWQSAVTTDMLLDRVDFVVEEHDPRRIGRKSLAVNLSDLAAMGARPIAAFISLALPQQNALALAKELYEGLLPLAAEFQVAIAGGDTNSWEGPLAISITAVGEVEEGRALVRSGAKPGDAIFVTGELGGSILGKHFDFTPRLREARWLAEHTALHAAIDISDGLSLDLSRLVTASSCGALVDLARIPISSAASALARQNADGGSALDHALADGEDFELIFALPSDEAENLRARWPFETPLTQIGACIPQPGLWTSDTQGVLQSVAPRGWEY